MQDFTSTVCLTDCKTNDVKTQDNEQETGNGGQPKSNAVAIHRHVPLAAWIIVVITLFLISMKIMSYGFVPGGDARRHVAKAFTEKPYTEIVVMRPGYTVDHSPGWEWLFGLLHRKAGWNADGLVSFSIVGTLLCIFLAPLPWLRRPEAWLAALLAQMLAVPELMIRLTQARPYLLTEGILIAVLFSWSKTGSSKPSWLKLALTGAGFSLSVWMHGSWYLWILPLVAFFLARAWRAGFWLTACWLAGTFMGAMLTGKPFEFLKTALVMAFAVYRENAPQWLLVGEFRPSYGEFSTLVLLAIVFLWIKQQGKSGSGPGGQPVVWLIAISWVLGLRADRCWADWGIPAVLVWLAMQFEEVMTTFWSVTCTKRLMACGLIALPLFFHSTNDLDRRYTHLLDDSYLDATDPRLQGWLPEANGIFYSAQMEFFYNTFYKNPRADWRYILGFEPALMPEEDLKIFRHIQLNRWVPEAYQPWINKMRPADRLMLLSPAQPGLPQLEWHNAVGSIWIGRLPKSNPR